jgi:hypothetical protein
MHHLRGGRVRLAKQEPRMGDHNVPAGRANSGAGDRRGGRQLVATSALFLVSLAVTILLVGQAGVGIADEPDWILEPYSYGDRDCHGHITDPFTIKFHGAEAGVNTVSDQIVTHTNLNNQGDDPGQSVYLRPENGGINFTCYAALKDNSNGCGTCTRYHIRLWRVPEPTDQKKTIGTPHHEEWHSPTCGFGGPNHAVVGNNETPDGSSGFDQGRRFIKDGFVAGGHAVDYAIWGNTIRVRQCDGDNAGSNGTVANIWVGHSQG